MTINDITGEAEGIARFLYSNLLIDKDKGHVYYICSDSSRNVFNYKDSDGNIQKDVRCSMLLDAVNPELDNRIKELIFISIYREENGVMTWKDQLCGLVGYFGSLAYKSHLINRMKHEASYKNQMVKNIPIPDDKPE